MKNKENIIFDFEKSKNNFKQVIKIIKENNIDLLDGELINDLLKDNMLVYENNFFNEIKRSLCEEYDLDDIYLLFNSKLNDFNVISIVQNKCKLIIIPTLFFEFLNKICLYILHYYELNFQNDNENDLKRVKNYIIGLIDIYVNNKKRTKFDEFEISLHKDEKVAIKAAIIARHIVLFVICHELAHLVFDRENKVDKFNKEIYSDEMGLIFFSKVIEKATGLYGLHYDYYRAPLIFFEIFDFIEYYKKLILEHKNNNSEYPLSVIRKNALISKFIFPLENETSSFYYVLFTDIFAELKYYLFQNCETVKYNIKKINFNESDVKNSI